MQLTLTLKMTTAQVVEMSVTFNNNSPIQDYVYSDDQTQPTFEMTPGFKPFPIINCHPKVKESKIEARMKFGHNVNNTCRSPLCLRFVIKFCNICCH